MSMNVGGGGGDSDGDVMMDINTTPLIDVMLVLIVMLIITLPIQLHSVNINMPVGIPPKSDVKPEVVKVDIDGRSQIFWNAEPVADRSEFESRLHEASKREPQPELHIRPDKGAKYEIVAGVLASAQRLGMTRLGIIGSEQFVE
jgi:biopolymer transport protein ExbD